MVAGSLEMAWAVHSAILTKLNESGAVLVSHRRCLWHHFYTPSPWLGFLFMVFPFLVIIAKMKKKNIEMNLRPSLAHVSPAHIRHEPLLSHFFIFLGK